MLVVDDDPGTLDCLREAFEHHGCLVSASATAGHALARLAAEPVDLVVSDIRMPGLSGLDLLDAVKRRRPGTPVVLLTGLPSIDSALFGLRQGAYDYLTKPASMNALADLVQRVRRDSRAGTVTQPACVAEDVARQQVGTEALFRVAELGVKGLEPAVFIDLVLASIIEGLQADGAMMIQRQEDGSFTHCRKGSEAVVDRLVPLLRESIADLVEPGWQTAVSLTGADDPIVAQAVRIPGPRKATAILCVAREAHRGAFLPDEVALLLGYARTTALALENVLVREEDEGTVLDTVAFFVRTLESKDPALQGHSARVSLYAGDIATSMSLPPPEVSLVRRASLLHDLGKLVILDSVLQKPGRLTEAEYALVRRHPLIAEKILRSFRRLDEEATVVRHHLERYDGTGSPDRLEGDQIPMAARILAVADAFDAMTSPRPYRATLPLDVARDEVLGHAGTQFHPLVAEAFGAIPVARLAEISRFYRTTGN
ncbi:MAG: response regulator [Candidatus Rokubacteria bacterium]|nr:response regulator [Candidatus Rokubacteria bacterium]